MSKIGLLIPIDENVFKTADMPQQFIEINPLYDIQVLENKIQEVEKELDAWKDYDWVTKENEVNNMDQVVLNIKKTIVSLEDEKEQKKEELKNLD